MSNTPFAVFPVGPDKRPLIAGWQDKATCDPRIIARWEEQGVVAWGVPCGPVNDLFVIDLDVDKKTGEPVGEASLAATRYFDLIGAACVRTPTGGRHIYLRHFQGARNTQNKIGPKIDTRGQGGYVVAPGSVIESGTYTGRFPCGMSPVPMGLRAMLLPVQRAAKVFQMDRETPTGEVQELLAYLDPDLSYGDWLAVLMALHDRYGGSEEGLTVADAWSAKGAKYRAGEVRSKWTGFKTGGVTWATIPALARRHGADLSEIARRWAA